MAIIKENNHETWLSFISRHVSANFFRQLVKIVRAISLIIDDHLKKQKCGFSQTKSVAVSKIADDDSHAAKQQKQCRESIFKYI